MRTFLVCALVAVCAPLRAAELLPMPHQVRVDSTNDPLPPDATLRIGAHRYRTGGDTHVAYAPDGKTFVTLNPKIGLSALWDADTLRRLRRDDLREAIGPGRVVHIQGNLILWYTNSTVVAWDLVSNRALGKIGEKDAAWGNGTLRVCLSSNGHWLAGAVPSPQGGYALRKWELATGRSMGLAKVKPLPDVLAISNDGGTVAWAEYEGWQKESTVHTLSELHGAHRFASSSSSRQLHLSPDGEVVLAYPYGLFSTAGQALSLEDGGGHFIDAQASFSADSRYLIVPTHEGIAIDSIPEGKRVHLFRAAHGAAALSPDGKTLLTLGTTLRRWDVESGNALDPDSEGWGAHGPASWLFFHAHAPRLVIGSAPGCESEVSLWDADSGKLVAEQQLFLNRFKYPAGDGKHVVASHPAIGRWQMIDVLTSQTTPELQFLPQASSSRLLLVTHAQALQDGRILVLVRTISFADNFPMGGVFCSDGSVELPLIASLWDMQTKQLLEYNELSGELNWQELLISPDGRSAVNGVRQYTLPTGRTLPALESPRADRFFTPQVYSLDSRLIAGVIGHTAGVSGYEDAVAIYERGSGKRLHTLQTGRVGGMLFTPDGKSLAVATPRAVELWDLASGAQVLEWKLDQADWFWDTDPKHKPAMGFSPDSRQFAISLPEGDALVYRLPCTCRKEGKLSDSELEQCWNDLNSEDPAQAYAAGSRLAAYPTQAIGFLRDSLAREADSAEASIPRWLEDLDAQRFIVRETASKELSKLGPLGYKLLMKALRESPSDEKANRIEGILDRFGPYPVGEVAIRRYDRSVAVLERIGTPAACQLLRRLATGEVQTPVGILTRESLQRAEVRLK